MLFSNIFLTIILSSILIILNYYAFEIISKHLKIDNIISKLVFFNHLFFSIIFLSNDLFSFFNISPGADSISYFLHANENSIKNINYISINNNLFMYFIFLLKKLKFDFISINFIFGFIGSISILIFYHCISKLFLNKYDQFLILIFILFPSLNFWSSGITKDVFVIFSSSIFLLAFTYNNIKIMLGAFIILILLKLHMAILVVLSFIFTIFLMLLISKIIKKDILIFGKKVQKIYILILLILSCLFIYLVDLYIFENSLSRLLIIIQNFQSLYENENFIESKNILRTIEYFFRPYIWEADNLILKYIGFENIILFLLLILFSYNFKSKKLFFLKSFTFSYDLKYFILLSFFAFAIFQIILTSNTGIAWRQKWYVLPGIIYSIYYFKYILFIKYKNK